MNLLLDLDGTLTDSRPGIVRAISHALDRLGYDPVDEAELARHIGMSLYAWFRNLLGTDSETLVRQAVDIYREYYAARGMYESEVYAGIHAALEAQGARGVRMIIATSKPRVSATRIAEHFGLDRHLAAVWGSELDGRRADKAALIAHVLEAEGLEPRETIMVGDRYHDAEGAQANGIACAGVLWGYGARQELSAAGCTRFLAKPAELAVLDL
ncbi:MAG: HAD hydrolase-like protein [Gammaproteobacteria bacterium]|nr:HAD hydrolase-like protein [Gammaproteobacteria bacterium]MDH4253486.1 HAD hydrolase-like protein [Gammaproteobacteria bacterium]MDH5309719.1 HAD hydrolase-like protein [Gammaproteobacteria bacterium]